MLEVQDKPIILADVPCESPTAQHDADCRLPRGGAYSAVRGAALCIGSEYLRAVHIHINFDCIVMDYLCPRRFSLIGNVAKWGLSISVSRSLSMSFFPPSWCTPTSIVSIPVNLPPALCVIYSLRICALTLPTGPTELIGKEYTERGWTLRGGGTCGGKVCGMGVGVRGGVHGYMRLSAVSMIGRGECTEREKVYFHTDMTDAERVAGGRGEGHLEPGDEAPRARRLP
ncbi:hypothetical protein HYPSUDRAFT_210158 [Hypholoma sublateritium FD-334 SS-4]|uniref:Uncharacterized protein n=1 Tax=Hypholoma sublateritium (strain FD-334 SS-4) TaxID=945553 RepID=A0A0D2LPQ8_HYPSF|nr:hypothetical protein HYPSUDRAFT_210158 [Hypholoma sublateritium FD-334 SS-4]